jgi:flagellar hook assembly protein FlgD
MIGPLLDRATQELRLLAPFPQPFTTSVSWDLLLAHPTMVAGEVVDVAGRRVATLVSRRRLPAGPHRFQWNGKDLEGAVANPGVYFLRIRTTEGSHFARLIKLR